MVETGRFALVAITPGLYISCGVPYRIIEFAQETGRGMGGRAKEMSIPSFCSRMPNTSG
jgi:hypothetical protein